MSRTKSYKKKKHIENQLVVMSRIDFEIAKRVYERILDLGMDDEEVSFLMGKRNKYVFDILDPTEKDKFKTEQLDYLPTILKTSIQSLVPDRHRSALELYQKSENHFGEGAFYPSDLQKCLSVLMTAKGSHQLLKRVNVKARYYYVGK